MRMSCLSNEQLNIFCWICKNYKGCYCPSQITVLEISHNASDFRRAISITDNKGFTETFDPVNNLKN